MAQEDTQALGNAASDNAPQVGGDAHTMQDVGDMIAAAENELSHATQQLSKEEMEQQRVAARVLINQIFTDGNSTEMAKNMVAAQYPAMAGELDSLVEREQSRHGDVPETQAEADQRKEEAAKENSGALIGGAALLAGGAALAGGFLAGMFGGDNEKYKEGAGALLGANAPDATHQANLMGALLANHVQGVASTDQQPNGVTHGIPGKVQQQGTGIKV